MLTADFDYDLPPELIAQRPLPRRDQSRMMVVQRKTATIIHSRFLEFPSYLSPHDALVVNTAKVIPAKFWGKKEDKDIEFLLLQEQEPGVWEVLCRPAKKVKKGEPVTFTSQLEARVVEVKKEGKRLIRFSSPDVLSQLEKIGYAPLPPYIKRRKKDEDLRKFDLERYQTVFAQEGKAIAAPTAGLHFTPKMLNKVKKRDVEIVPISLDVGLATFQPVRALRVENHHLLEESYTVSKAAARTLNEAKKESRKLTAVGTTSVRALESAYQNGKIKAGRSSTQLFIYPGYEFKVVDSLLTNFHLPKSTLLMLVSSFAGMDLVKKAYAEAVREKYRFYSYGDCMLII
ncbi:MAG: tRNA preQ1(34) S-adenosylmethionine ribosyltransferase-isomerase QueA [Candidatus Aminicenantes bacterium]